ncbi:MAG: hypothetical protein QOF85_2830 [Solirubrobacterales bacterium]|jgi:hypothetical protein|nr:hypothetical protein [Solirubrobacterales bacterium]
MPPRAYLVARTAEIQETATTTEVLVVTGTGSVMNITGVMGEQKEVPIVTTRMNVGTRIMMTDHIEFTCVWTEL